MLKFNVTFPMRDDWGIVIMHRKYLPTLRAAIKVAKQLHGEVNKHGKTVLSAFDVAQLGNVGQLHTHGRPQKQLHKRGIGLSKPR